LEQLAARTPDRAPELERPARAIAAPEWHLAGLARGGRDQHAVDRDVLDAPGARAEQEHVAGARLEHHLLVELADAHALAPVARKTPDGPGAGVVPPLITATRRAPRRALRRWLTRSHTRRGASSANSSDG